MLNDLTVIIITYQEENNIQDCIKSVQAVTNNILIVDSFSTDNTQNIAKEMGATCLEYDFISYADKRNWAQNNNPFNTKWVIHIDADERFSEELSMWFLNTFPNIKDEFDGFIFSRKIYFLNKWIKHGDQYPNYHLRLFKAENGYVENKAYDSHFILKNGKTKTVKSCDIINNVTDSLDNFIYSHNKWATLEANDIVKGVNQTQGDIISDPFGNPIERRRWLRLKIFNKSPHFIRSFIYFFYLYVLRLGFLDGKQGLIYFVLQSFRLRFLIDAKVFEILNSNLKN